MKYVLDIEGYLDLSPHVFIDPEIACFPFLQDEYTLRMSHVDGKCSPGDVVELNSTQLN